MGDAPAAPAISPKLLELDKEDVKAVRSFLPGKVLGRTAALLALVVLVLGFAGSLDVGLERFLGFPLEPRWLKYSVLIGLPVRIVGAQILAEWIAERKRKQAQALAVKVDAVPEGYFRIGPYLDTAEDRAKFDRADRIHEKVLAWIKWADATPLYLTGDSGSGKSSVLSAFALPELREASWTVVEARAWQDPEAALSEAIKKLADAKKWRPGEAKTLRALLEALAKRADEKVLLVLDQFEEFFILAGSDRQKAFTAFLDDLRAKPIKGLKLLLVLRSDYKTAIDELGLPLLRQGENWQEVVRFTIAAGAKFMTRSGLALQSLTLTGTKVADLAPLNGLTALQSLDLINTPVADLAPLKGLTALQSFNLYGTRVADLAPLRGLTALRSLDLYGTQVADLAPLGGLTALQWLDLSGTKVADLAPLQDLSSLGTIDGVPYALLQTLNDYRSQKGLPVIKGVYKGAG